MGADVLSSRAIQGMFYNRLEQNAGVGWVPKISITPPFQSDQAQEQYKWLGMSPALREWIGGRHAKGFRNDGITIENKEFEATIEFLVRELKRDKTGQVQVRINELADRTNGHWPSLISTLINNGETGVCYDGQYFFDTTHAEGDSGTQSNSLSINISDLPASLHGTTTAPSSEEFALCTLQAIQAIMGFKDDRGEPMNELAQEFLVMAPISLMTPMSSAVGQDLIGTGQSNIIKPTGYNVIPVANPRLTWTTQFAVFRADAITKPIIRQEEEGVQFGMLGEGSETEFYYKKHLYGVSTSRNAGFGYWQQACLVTMT